MFLKRVKNIFKYFKNPVAVIKFLLSRKKIDKPFFIIPKNGSPIKIGRSSDGWIINKILGGEKIIKISEQILINGLFLREGTSDTFIYKEIFLDECYKKCLDFVNRQSTILDIGAYIGLFACYVAPECKKVYAYEPVIENYNQALKNVKDKNIYLFNSAVWSTGGGVGV